jgi:hypothetical protein
VTLLLNVLAMVAVMPHRPTDQDPWRPRMFESRPVIGHHRTVDAEAKLGRGKVFCPVLRSGNDGIAAGRPAIKCGLGVDARLDGE